jgi:hypothetical protein
MFSNCPKIEQSEPPSLSEEEFNARLARNVAIQAEHMKTLEEARRNTAGLRETNDAVDDLRRLREILMEHVERTDRQARGLLRLDEYENCDKTIDPGMKCLRLAKAVRQTVVLQQELLGLRAAPGARALAGRETRVSAPEAEAAPEEAPEVHKREDHRDRDRDDLRDRDDTYDYDDRPYDQVIAAIREGFRIPAEAAPVKRVRSAVLPCAMPGPHVTALAGAQAPAPFRRERGPP